MTDSVFNEKFSSYAESAEKYLAARTVPKSRVEEAMAYTLSAGGKRIRPVLALAVCDMLCGEPERALDYACAVELIHTYSLIHDDLPCMDNDDVRRGKPSCHIVYGETIALLAGDGLLTKAFSLAANGGNPDAIAVIAENAYKMVLGQADEFVNIDNDLSVDNIIAIHKCKTAALLIAAASCGGIAAGADSDTISKLKEFALNLGLAFQVRDDLLDADTEDSALIRKLGRNGAEELASELSEKAAGAISGFENNTFLLELTERLLHRDK